MSYDRAMKIADIEVHEVVAPLERRFWMSLEPYSTASELLVFIRTTEGLTGIGQIHGRPLDQIANILVGEFRPRLLGASAHEHERIWASLFALTHTRDGALLSADDGQPHFGQGARAQVMAAIAGVDIALWDLKGKSLGIPVAKLLGGSRDAVPCYASGGYYGTDGGADLDALVEEVGSYVQQGFRSVKIKVAGLPIDEDERRVAAVREAIGADTDLMLDANQGYDIPTAIEAARAFEPYRIRWLEEPIHWYDGVRGLGRVAAATRIPIASGESELHRWSCRDLVLEGGVSVMQFDATRAGGVTEWLRVAAYASAHGVGMAPHHDPQIHGHLVAGVQNGLIQETFPNKARDPLWDALYDDRPEIKNGILRLNSRPGFGFSINQEGLRRYLRRSWVNGVLQESDGLRPRVAAVTVPS